MKTHPYFQPSILSKRYLLCLILITGLSSMTVHAQGTYKLSTAPENIVKVSGKSNVHDWTMNALNPASEAEFGALSGDNTPKALTALSFSVNAKSLKSEHSSMDSRTYKVIKADSHPKITFKLSSAVVTPVSKNKFSIKATGALSIAGVTKTITMDVNGVVNADQSITCTGTEKLKLTEYEMQPPSFMLGAMKVGDELTISFTLNYKK